MPPPPPQPPPQKPPQKGSNDISQYFSRPAQPPLQQPLLLVSLLPPQAAAGAVAAGSGAAIGAAPVPGTSSTSEQPAAGTASAVPALPAVARFSALFDFLSLCEVGCQLSNTVLQCVMRKDGDDTWMLESCMGEGQEWDLSTLGLLREMRGALQQQEPGIDLERSYVHIEPSDKLAMKREIATGKQPAEPPECVDRPPGIVLCCIDITPDDGWVETATGDGGPSVPRQVRARVRVCVRDGVWEHGRGGGCAG